MVNDSGDCSNELVVASTLTVCGSSDLLNKVGRDGNGGSRRSGGTGFSTGLLG